MKDKNCITITNSFQKTLDESNRKSNKIWVDEGSEFYNRLMKSWFQDNDKEMYSTHNKRKSVVGERFMRTLKNKILKYMTSMSRNVNTDKLADIVNEYINTYQSTMKPIDVKSSTYIDFGIENKDKDAKFEVGDHVRLSKCKNIFAKGYAPNCSEEVFLIKKVKNTIPWTYIIEAVNGEEIFGKFTKKNCKRQIKQNLG